MGIRSFTKIENYFKVIYAGRKLASSYIFTGSEEEFRIRGAKFVAKLANCLQEPKPCKVCEVCRKIEEELHENILFVTSEKKIGIDTIRRIQKFVSFRAFSSGAKVVIINRAQNMSSEAANAFLKVLEEPPGGTIIILLVPDLANLLPTITSRCQIIRFSISYAERERFFISKF